MLGVLATALFFGDAMITPAISVLSAVEGLSIVESRVSPIFVIPISIAILIGLFLLPVARNRYGRSNFSGRSSSCILHVLAVLGVMNIINRPDVLKALQPALWAVDASLLDDPLLELSSRSARSCSR